MIKNTEVLKLYNEIKNKLIDNEVYKRVKDYSKNRNDLSTYYEVGKLLIKALEIPLAKPIKRIWISCGKAIK